MNTMNKPPERGPHTANTSFIEGTPSGRIMASEELRIRTGNELLQQEYPDYGKDGDFLILKIPKAGERNAGKLVVVGPQKGETLLFQADGKTINPKISKTDMKKLG